MAIKLPRFFITGFIVTLLLWSNGLAQNRILIVHSYHNEYDWTRSINDSLEVSFKAAGIPYKIYYMDTKRNAGETWKKKSARKARQIVQEYKPTVVIAVDDNAQAYFVKEYVNKSSIQFVFCGVNAPPESYGYPAANVTGILERAYTIQTLHVLKTLIPSTRKVALVSDYSPTANEVLARVKALTTKINYDIKIVQYHQPIHFSEWKKTIKKLDRDREIDALLIPIYHTVRQDHAQTSVIPSQIMRWTINNTSKPIVGLWPFIINDGGLLAVIIDPHEHGRVAAQMALEIIQQGKKASDIAMRVNREGYVIVNLKNKQHLNFDSSIKIDQIADKVIR